MVEDKKKLGLQYLEEQILILKDGLSKNLVADTLSNQLEINVRTEAQYYLQHERVWTPEDYLTLCMSFCMVQELRKTWIMNQKEFWVQICRENVRYFNEFKLAFYLEEQLCIIYLCMVINAAEIHFKVEFGRIVYSRNLKMEDLDSLSQQIGKSFSSKLKLIHNELEQLQKKGSLSPREWINIAEVMSAKHGMIRGRSDMAFFSFSTENLIDLIRCHIYKLDYKLARSGIKEYSLYTIGDMKSLLKVADEKKVMEICLANSFGAYYQATDEVIGVVNIDIFSRQIDNDIEGDKELEVYPYFYNGLVRLTKVESLAVPENLTLTQLYKNGKIECKKEYDTFLRAQKSKSELILGFYRDINIKRHGVTISKGDLVFIKEEVDNFLANRKKRKPPLNTSPNIKEMIEDLILRAKSANIHLDKSAMPGTKEEFYALLTYFYKAPSRSKWSIKNYFAENGIKFKKGVRSGRDSEIAELKKVL
jgi:hypothetical protein